MNEHFFTPRRSVQPHAAVQDDTAPNNTAENNGLQPGEAAHSDVQQPIPSPIEDYTISVEQVRGHFAAKGLKKSKDTVQRWCRTGELDCHKRGVLGRYYVTEASLLTLEKKLLPDMMADGAGENAAARGGKQAHEAAMDAVVQRDAGVADGVINDMPLHAAVDEPARTSVQANTREKAAARGGVQQTDAQVAELRAQVAGLTDQLAQAQNINAFLQDEIVSARGQRGDVVKIANRMLGTLETIAIGGRLERPQEAPEGEPTPVRYRPAEDDRSAV